MKRLIAFIESHGFRVTANPNGTVTFGVPYMTLDRQSGTQFYTVTDYREARNALGY